MNEFWKRPARLCRDPDSGIVPAPARREIAHGPLEDMVKLAVGLDDAAHGQLVLECAAAGAPWSWDGIERLRLSPHFPVEI